MPILFSTNSAAQHKKLQSNFLLLLGISLIIFAILVMAKPEILAYLVAYGCLFIGISLVWLWYSLRK